LARLRPCGGLGRARGRGDRPAEEALWSGPGNAERSRALDSDDHTPDGLRDGLIARYEAVRARTEALAAPLSPEDQLLQSMPECSPTKWHRAHTTWFFETFVLGLVGGDTPDSRHAFLWNSYYEAIGQRHPRPARGLLSRPSVQEITAWRRVIDDRVKSLLDAADAELLGRLAPILELGLAHEEQHQELMLTDLLDALSRQPFDPVYTPTPTPPPPPIAAAEPRWMGLQGGVVEIGHTGRAFAFDNESPRHRVYLAPFSIRDRLVTVGEVRAFVADGGYRTPSLWLSAGWDLVRAGGLTAPAHLEIDARGEATLFTLHGRICPSDDAPASHLSHYEADAIARWLGARLPTEAEWEHAAAAVSDDDVAAAGFDVDDDGTVSELEGGVGDGGAFFGRCWQWTQSAYQAYPGFRPADGVVGEYNGKFMVGQQVLRGSSSATPRGHARRTYRNFWPAHTRFQVAGLRLARDVRS
jgi:ergothioneine biosynthesis protein EgtB